MTISINRKMLLATLVLGLGGSAAQAEESCETRMCAVNGSSLNGVSLQGVQINGVQINGVGSNGQNLNGTSAQGVTASGLRQPTRAAEAIVTTVVLPSGETIDLR